MLRTLLPSLLLASLAHALPVPGALKEMETHQRTLYQQTAPAVVFIAAGGATGSGFLISSDGFILTNAHVVGKNARVDVVMFDGSKKVGTVVERARGDIDLALVRIEGSNLPHLRLMGGAVPRPGDFVAALGHGEGAVWSFNLGSVSNSYHLKNGERLIQTQIPLNPGNSGGPVLNLEGRVVGVVTAGVTGANSINFAVPIGLAPRSFEHFDALCDCVEVRAPAQVPVLLDGSMIGHGPRLWLLPDGEAHEVMAVVQGVMKKKQYKGSGAAVLDLNR
ncbi:MAG: serine protease [Pseudomonadota bacterium]